jgi:hypothetical protein
MGIELYTLWFTGWHAKVQPSLRPEHAAQMEEPNPPSFVIDGIAIAAQPKVLKSVQARKGVCAFNPLRTNIH